jgi:hypothetical protein
MELSPRFHNHRLSERDTENVVLRCTESGILDFSGADLGDDRALFLADAIQSSLQLQPRLRHINLNYTGISASGFDAIVSSAAEMGALESFSCRQNTLPREAGLSVSRLLGSRGSLAMLDLRENKLGDVGVASIAGAFTTDISETLSTDKVSFLSLCILDISDNNFGDMGVLTLCRGLSQFARHTSALGRLSSLKALRMNKNNIGDKGAMCLAQLVGSMQTERALRFASHRGHQSASLQLQELGLSANPIGGRGLRALLNVAAGQNSIGANGSSLESSTPLPPVPGALKVLCLAGCNWTLPALGAAAQAISSSLSNLEYLDISFNDEGAEELLGEAADVRAAGVDQSVDDGDGSGDTGGGPLPLPLPLGSALQRLAAAVRVPARPLVCLLGALPDALDKSFREAAERADTLLANDTKVAIDAISQDPVAASALMLSDKFAPAAQSRDSLVAGPLVYRYSMTESPLSLPHHIPFAATSRSPLPHMPAASQATPSLTSPQRYKYANMQPSVEKHSIQRAAMHQQIPDELTEGGVSTRKQRERERTPSTSSTGDTAPPQIPPQVDHAASYLKTPHEALQPDDGTGGVDQRRHTAWATEHGIRAASDAPAALSGVPRINTDAQVIGGRDVAADVFSKRMQVPRDAPGRAITGSPSVCSSKPSKRGCSPHIGIGATFSPNPPRTNAASIANRLPKIPTDTHHCDLAAASTGTADGSWLASSTSSQPSLHEYATPPSHLHQPPTVFLPVITTQSTNVLLEKDIEAMPNADQRIPNTANGDKKVFGDEESIACAIQDAVNQALQIAQDQWIEALRDAGIKVSLQDSSPKISMQAEVAKFQGTSAPLNELNKDHTSASPSSYIPREIRTASQQLVQPAMSQMDPANLATPRSIHSPVPSTGPATITSAKDRSIYTPTNHDANMDALLTSVEVLQDRLQTLEAMTITKTPSAGPGVAQPADDLTNKVDSNPKNMAKEAEDELISKILHLEAKLGENTQALEELRNTEHLKTIPIDEPARPLHDGTSSSSNGPEDIGSKYEPTQDMSLLQHRLGLLENAVEAEHETSLQVLQALLEQQSRLREQRSNRSNRSNHSNGLDEVLVEDHRKISKFNVSVNNVNTPNVERTLETISGNNRKTPSQDEAEYPYAVKKFDEITNKRYDVEAEQRMTRMHMYHYLQNQLIENEKELNLTQNTMRKKQSIDVKSRLY